MKLAADVPFDDRLNQAVSLDELDKQLIGQFLKELDLSEGRSTGVPKIRRNMEQNGSPQAKFETDDERTY